MTERIVENSARMTLLQVCTIVVNAALYFILARLLTSADYGIASCTVIPLLMVIRTGAFGALVLGTSKIIAANPDTVSSCISVSRKAYVIVGTAGAALFLLCGGAISHILRDPSLTPYFRLTAIAVLPIAGYALLHATLIGLKDFRSDMLMGILFQVVKLALTVLLVLIGMKVYGLIFGFAIACIILMLAFRRKMPSAKGPSTITLLSYFYTTSGIFIASGVAMVQRYVNLWNLKRIVFDNQTVAYYSVASQLASVPALIFSGAVIALWPAISGLSSTPDRSIAAEHLRKSLKYVMIGLLPISAILAALPDYAIRIAFGQQYARGAAVLPILVLSLILLALQSLLISAMVALGKVKTITCILATAAIVTILVGNTLIPTFGIEGAAATEIIGFLISATGAALVSTRIFGNLASFSETAKITSLALVVFLIVRSFAFLGHWVALVIAAAFGLYSLALITLGIISTDEIRQVLSRLKTRIARDQTA
ncbi:MAG TPA: oligosaccharide flippase family protein [bacterium]|nr:oligosaccharide flippase family protein [bacterium]